jgi:hypothetical protein
MAEEAGIEMETTIGTTTGTVTAPRTDITATITDTARGR